MTTENLAKLLYQTYCKAVGGKAFNGDPLPMWDNFRADPNKKLQSDAWVAAAETAQLAACHQKLHEACLEIENLPASTWQTELSIAASNVSGTVQSKLYPHI